MGRCFNLREGIRVDSGSHVDILLSGIKIQYGRIYYEYITGRY